MQLRRLSVPLAAVIRQVRSPLLMTAAITFLEVLSQTPLALPYAARGLLYVLLVAVAAAADGLRAALVSGLLAVAFASYAPYLSGRAPDGRDLFALVFACVVAALAVGGLRERQDRLRLVLEAERERLRAQRLAPAEFMNAAAHELRTPVTVVTGYLSMLQEGSFGPAPPRWAAVLDIVARKAHELSGLVEQMLLASSVDVGMVDLPRLAFDLRQAVQQAVERADPRATLLQASLSYQLPSHALPVEADPEAVGRILDVLIDNALTYGGRQPWVRITVSDEGDAQVLVEDHGRGIPPEMKERIFERFVRAEDPDHTPVPGTGLGLAISRGLAEQQGGSLAVLRSELGAGSVFALRLPLRRASPVAAGS